jgi:hypothetical protein
MNNVLRSSLILLTAAWLILGPPDVWAQSAEPAGRFVSVVGDVNIVGRDGAQRNAARGGEFREGETIVTGPEALAQLRMADGALLSVRGNTEFNLVRFAYDGKEDRNASVLMSILRGGFRTITGLIAQINRSGYAIKTPSGSIGVRGTHFEVVHVLPQTDQQVAAGTYIRVYEGITTMQSAAGPALQVIRDQTAFAALQATAAPVLVAPPAAIFGRPTPVPRATFQPSPRAEDRGEDRGLKGPAAAPDTLPSTVSPAVSPIEAPRTVSPALVSPIEAPRTVRPTLVSPIEAAPARENPSMPMGDPHPTLVRPIEAAPALQTSPTLIQPVPTIQTAPATTHQPTPALTPIQTAPILQPAVPIQPAPPPSQPEPAIKLPAIPLVPLQIPTKP